MLKIPMSYGCHRMQLPKFLYLFTFIDMEDFATVQNYLVIKSAKSSYSYTSLQVQIVRHHGKSSLLPLLTTISVIPKLNGLGDNLPIEQHLLQDLKDITKVYIYKVGNAKSMGEARAIKNDL